MSALVFTVGLGSLICATVNQVKSRTFHLTAQNHKFASKGFIICISHNTPCPLTLWMQKNIFICVRLKKIVVKEAVFSAHRIQCSVQTMRVMLSHYFTLVILNELKQCEKNPRALSALLNNPKHSTIMETNQRESKCGQSNQTSRGDTGLLNRRGKEIRGRKLGYKDRTFRFSTNTKSCFSLTSVAASQDQKLL